MPNHLTTAQMAELIAKGQPCPSCGISWYYYSDPKRGSFLQHAEGCLYIQLTESSDND